MTFQPVVPLGGLAGWRFLERTADAQQKAFSESSQVVRATDYFRENIGKIETAEQLVNDRRLLEVALGAFGLSDDIDNKFFIQKVLSDGTIDREALGNRLSDKRYLEMSRAFGFGDFPVPNTRLSSFADDIVTKFERQSFQVAVGEVNQDMRLAMNLESSLEDVINSTNNNDARWFSILGDPPLRRVIETALGLPSSIGAIDIDQQLDAFKDAAASNFGSDLVADLNTEESKEKLIRLFLFRSEAQSGPSITGNSVALALLSQIA